MITIEELNQLAREHAAELGLGKLASRLEVKWNPRMRSTAGRAHYQGALIELNPKLLEISEEELHRTFLHELAHLVAYERSRPRWIAPHGVEWRMACRDLGIPNERVTHDLPLPSRTQARHWHYTCPSCDKVITRARRMKRSGVACYPCCCDFNGGRYDSKYQLQEHYVGE